MLTGTEALRFHPGCYYRDEDGATQALPALIAAVTDGEWPDHGRAPHLACAGWRRQGAGRNAAPRHGRAARQWRPLRLRQREEPAEVIAAGEGIETMLSLRMALPAMPVIAALSTAHLGGLLLPDGLRRLYIAADSDGAGRSGTQRLSRRALEAGIETLTLRPVLGDFNDDLRRSGAEALRLHVIRQLAPGDAARFLI